MNDSREPSFIRGLLVSYLILFISVPLTILPLIGPVLAITLIPYLSGAVGARSAHPKERVPLALTCSMTWAVLETAIILMVLSLVTRDTPMGLVVDVTGLWIIALLWLSNIIFMLLGTFHPWKDPYADLK